MKSEVKALRELVGNKIFSVEFVKKDGSIRTMTCRLGVKKHLKGGSLNYDAEALNYLPVFDLQANDYRTINISTLRKIKVDGIEYDVE